MKDLMVKDIMTRPVFSVRNQESLKKVVKLLDQNNFSGLIVVDEEEKVTGVISERDVLKYTRWVVGHPVKDPYSLMEDEAEAAHVSGHRGLDVIEFVATATAETVMTVQVIKIEEDSPALDAVRLMNKHKINRVPVVDSSGKLKGIVTRADVLREVEKWANIYK